MLTDICRKCGNCNFDSDDIIDNDNNIIYLSNNREIGRFFNISIATSNSIAQYEIAHRDFLSLLLKSNFKFNQAVFYVLDVKFSTWRDSIIALSNIIRTLFVRYAQVNKKCAMFKKIIEDEIITKYRSKYVTILSNLRDYYISQYNKLMSNNVSDHDLTKYELNYKIIDVFSKVHEKLYNVFKQDILSIQQPEVNGQYDEYIRKYTKLLIRAMELTVVEAASINRIYIDKSVYVTSEVVNSIIHKKINIIENIVNETGIVPINIIFAEDGLERYEYLFTEYSK